jgi:hypothetical protein
MIISISLLDFPRPFNMLNAEGCDNSKGGNPQVLAVLVPTVNPTQYASRWNVHAELEHFWRQ